MKKLKVSLLLALSCTLLLAGCGKKKESADTSANQTETESETPNIVISGEEDPVSETEAAPTEAPVAAETRDGYVRSQLTGEWIDESLADSRPLAVMVPDNTSALPQYNVSKASIIYECLAEGKISRLMCLWDDWRDMGRIGNVRSARTYYVAWALEWDPIFCHYGNVFYADPILDSDPCDNINGTKSPYGYYRVTDEGRITEQTAYTSTDDVIKAANYYGYSLTHTQYFTKDHWLFASESAPTDLSAHADAIDCTHIDGANAFPVDKPYLDYNAEDGLYYRFQYSAPHIDGVDNSQLCFKNVLIQYCDYTVIDQYDHLDYATSSSGTGFFVTGGKAIPVTWSKGSSDTNPTKFYDSNGNEIVLNTGKTMVLVAGTGTTVSIE